MLSKLPRGCDPSNSILRTYFSFLAWVSLGTHRRGFWIVQMTNNLSHMWLGYGILSRLRVSLRLTSHYVLHTRQIRLPDLTKPCCSVQVINVDQADALLPQLLPEPISRAHRPGRLIPIPRGDAPLGRGRDL